jgi:uncharacterized protein YaaR (DUF327 family)
MTSESEKLLNRIEEIINWLDHTGDNNMSSMQVKRFKSTIRELINLLIQKTHHKELTENKTICPKCWKNKTIVGIDENGDLTCWGCFEIAFVNGKEKKLCLQEK